MKLAYSTMLFGRNITDGRATMCLIVALTIGHNPGMGDAEYGEIYDIHFLPAYLWRLDGSSCSMVDMWRICRAMMCSIVTLAIRHYRGMGEVEHGKIYDIYVRPAHLRLFNGPSCRMVARWRVLGRGAKVAGLVAGAIITPKMSRQPKPFGEACYAFRMGGDFIQV